MTAVSNSSFIYTPLRLSEHSFRLLYLEPARERSCIIRASITESSLQDHLPYESVSYVWGTGDRDKFILLNNCLLPVTESLEVALRYLHLRDRVRILWIDQICINQEDIDERCAQVKRMSRIYQNAVRNVVWLGEADDSSRQAFSWLKKVSTNSTCDSSTQKNIGFPASPIRSSSGTRLDTSSMTLHDWKVLGHTFLSRPIWSRVWIIQEFSFAKELILACGSDTLTWPEVQIVGQVRVELDRNPKLLGCFNHALFLEAIRARALNQNPMTLKDILFGTIIWEATDERDHVYAVLALSKDMGLGINPDYTRSTRDTFITTTIAIISHDKDLNVICRDQSQPELPQLQEASTVAYSLPSWVPRFGTAEILLDNLFSSKYNASKEGPSLRTKYSKSRHTISVKGQHISYLKHLWDTVAPGKPSRAMLHLKMFMSLPHGWPRFSYDLDWYMAGYGDFIWRTLLLDSELSMIRIREEEIPFYRREFTDWFKAMLHSSLGRVTRPAESRFTQTLELLPVCHRRLALTCGNHLVSVPWNSQVGDEICVLHSASVPTLMRDGERISCKLVGTAFVYGLMDGEVMRNVKLYPTKEYTIA